MALQKEPELDTLVISGDDVEDDVEEHDEEGDEEGEGGNNEEDEVDEEEDEADDEEDIDDEKDDDEAEEDDEKGSNETANGHKATVTTTQGFLAGQDTTAYNDADTEGPAVGQAITTDEPTIDPKRQAITSEGHDRVEDYSKPSRTQDKIDVMKKDAAPGVMPAGKVKGPAASFQSGKAMTTFKKIDGRVAEIVEKFNHISGLPKGLSTYSKAEANVKDIKKYRDDMEPLCKKADLQYNTKWTAAQQGKNVHTLDPLYANFSVDVTDIMMKINSMTKLFDKLADNMKALSKEMDALDKYVTWKKMHPIQALALEQTVMGVIKTAATHGLALVPGLGGVV